MNEEVERFFLSIGFSSEAFNDVKIEKVILNKRLESFEVVFSAPNVIDKKEIDQLFLCSNKGLKGKKCKIKIIYQNITTLDVKSYLNYYLDDLIKRRPSFVTLKNYELEIEKDKIYIIINDYLSDKIINNELLAISRELEKYFLGTFDLELKINNESKRSLKEELIKNNEIIEKEEKKEDSPIVLGMHIDGEVTNLNNIYGEMKNVIIEAYVFGLEYAERKGQKATAYIINFKISDYTNSFLAKLVKFDENEYLNIVKKLNLKADKASDLDKKRWFRFHGKIEMDQYLKCMILNVRNIEAIPSKDKKVIDDASQKRVELHAHTMMSVMDGVIDAKRLVNFAISLGHKAVAITDHNALQAYPDVFNLLAGYNKGKEEKDKFKAIYGTELNIVDTEAGLVYKKDKNYNFKDQVYVVFDTETTGLNPGVDQMIEIGAVKVKNNVIIDRFDELISCDRPLPEVITNLTCITDEMLKGKENEETITKKFLEFIGDNPLVAHNAAFDISFIEAACHKYNIGNFSNTVLDTMAIARNLYPNWSNHKLSTLVKNLDVPWDEDKHHRADYDCEGTSYCFYKMVDALDKQNISNIEDLNKLVDEENIIKFARPFHLTILAKNKEGLRNLFKIISLANTKYLFKGKEPKLPRKDLIENREGLIIGSGCINGEVFEKSFNLDDDEIRDMMAFYDYIEVYPLNVVSHLIGKEKFHNPSEYYGYLKRLIKIAKENNKLVVATGDVHNLREDDLIYRKIIINQKTNGRLHPLNKKGMDIPNQYFLTTNEMLEAFSFLSEDLRKEIVIDNPNKIADMTENLQIIKDQLYTPVLENSAEQTKEMVYKKAHEVYGENLPPIIEERLEKELNGIIGGGYDVIYLIAEKLVKSSNADGYFVGSRGSVGSSLVATMMGITEVNGLPPHYVCPKCKKTLFEVDGEVLSDVYPSGFDMPDHECEECHIKMNKNGHDIPFATFLGFKAEKVPDIDLNFSGENQATAHNNVKLLFGEDHAYRAGTISTVAEKTAYGYVRGYCEDKGIIINPYETERIAIGCTGVKRTTGQHPGGIIVIPQYMDVYDFTAYQYPADEPDSSWYTTHFDFHAIHDNVLKLDILGHDDPTMLKYLGDTTKIDIMSIPFDDPRILSLFLSPKELGVKEADIMCPTGTLGIPEFGTNFAIKMLLEIKPKYFADLVKIAGLSHGTDVWNGNVRDIIVNNIASFEEVPGCRDDITIKLISYGIDSSAAFKISEFVRKGKAKKEPDKWAEHVAIMNEADVPDWYIECCHKIQYMFPKAHACAYVMMSYRVAWFKLYYPLYYYSAFFSIRRSDFDIASMVKGADGIKRKIMEIREKGNNATAKELATADTLNVALEMLMRGYTFKNIDISISRAKTFVIDEENKCLYIPFMAVDGLGESVAFKIEEERKEKTFFSVEDFASRAKVNQTTVEKLRDLGIFEGMPESAQMSLF